TTKPFNKEVFKSTIPSIWRPPSGIRCKDIRNNLFLFVLNRNEDRDWISRKEPRIFFNRNLVLLQELNEEIHPSKITWEHCSLRIRVWGVPLVCLSELVGKRIWQSMGF
ncbi:DUF4283 domain-containing protein, partial [Cephalotus follicularis]